MSLIYSRDDTIGSWLIRAMAGFSRWSHGAILDGGHVIEALAFRGVVRTPYRVFRDRVASHEVVEVECPNPQAAIAFARAQVGKAYDWRALLGYVLHRPMESVGRMHCIELIESALIAGGRRRFRRQPFRLTPEQSSMVL